MRPSKEIWFTPSVIRGFGVVHWKGPLFIAAMALVGLPAALIAVANEDRHPVISLIGVLVAAGSLIVGYIVCQLHTADHDEGDDVSSSRDGHWRALPLWAKCLTIGFGFPAWLVLLTGVFRGEINSQVQLGAFVLFAAVALLQAVFLFRAYWRMEL